MLSIEEIKTICILATPPMLAIVMFLFMHFTRPLLDVVNGMRSGAGFLKDTIEAARTVCDPKSVTDAIANAVALERARLGKELEVAKRNQAEKQVDVLTSSAGRIDERFVQNIAAAASEAAKKYSMPTITFALGAATMMSDAQICVLLRHIERTVDCDTEGWRRLKICIQRTVQAAQERGVRKPDKDCAECPTKPF